MPSDIDRRGFIHSVLLPAFAAACRPMPRSDLGKADGEIVDVHCHLFNGKDLPIVTFITKVVIPKNERANLWASPAHGVEDPTVLEWVMELFKNRLLARTPSAADEIAYLRGRTRQWSSGTKQDAESQMVDALTDVVRGPQSGADAAPADRNLKIDGLRNLLIEQGGGAETWSLNRSAPMSERDARQIALAAYGRRTSLGTYLRWATLFMQYRHELAKRLIDNLVENCRTPVLLVPLMIDYSKWLGEEPAKGSSLRQQAEVFGLISQQRRTAPAIHGMVAYDPLRAVYHEQRPHTDPEDPLETVETAFREHGFLGAKLYPPMGFRATGNTGDQHYPPKILEQLGLDRAKLGSALDTALEGLYKLCLRYDAPVIAHGSITQGAGLDYAKRTDPAYWLRVLKLKPGLRVCIAHQGHFGYRSEAPETGGQIYEDIIGGYIKANPDSHLYMDISYLSEALGTSPASRQCYADRLSGWVRDYDPKAEHILFGTDWIMVGIEKASDIYTQSVAGFLQNDCQFTDGQVNRILRQNAGRYLGLREGDETRNRILGFYAANDMPASLLPRFWEEAEPAPAVTRPSAPAACSSSRAAS
ncbi:MAG: amidohydrolase family protein [Inquilinus limosus]|uniref:Amidohydrolase family protein n=1 Tax=Inquilinus limosus TaxID=171674 RepID=A0A952FHU0_9PROT|nr:amidohydrolase family protein [Inquilinus limosus]